MPSSLPDNNQIIFYNDGEIELNVSIENENVWLNRQQISELFDRDVKTIGKHINNVFKEKELEKMAVVAKFATTAKDNKVYNTEYYNLDIIISVGYRVKSQKGIKFRQWATNILKQYIFNGYAINSEKITHQRFKELENEVKILKTQVDKIDSLIVSKQLKLDIDKYNVQYKNLQIRPSKKFHDRFLIIDSKEAYHIGASLKDLGKKVFAFSKINVTLL